MTALLHLDVYCRYLSVSFSKDFTTTRYALLPLGLCGSSKWRGSDPQSSKRITKHENCGARHRSEHTQVQFLKGGCVRLAFVCVWFAFVFSLYNGLMLEVMGGWGTENCCLNINRPYQLIDFRTGDHTAAVLWVHHEEDGERCASRRKQTPVYLWSNQFWEDLYDSG